ncbi:MAG: hypothetical protein ACI88A_003309 [Paraglaciecola sp.]|jgi:uncharacterized protein with NAD-binding domain and iron-sulfur cluster
MPHAEKIAILGGGVSAMTAACYLTELPNWQEKYDITVYQLGWRLGGKGASGRNAEYGQRIEEHGLHVWFGSYVNSFKTLEKVYADLGRSSSVPISTFDQAFKPHSFIVVEEFIKQNWQSWGINFPLVSGDPADGNLDPSFWDLVKMIYSWLRQFTEQLVDHSNVSKKVNTNGRDSSWFTHVFNVVKDDVYALQDDIHVTHRLIDSFIQSVGSEHRFEHDEKKHIEHYKHQVALGGWLLSLKQWLSEEFDHLLDDDDELRRLYIGADLAITCLKGVIEDDVYRKGFAHLNQWDYRQWLTKHGANVEYTVNSAPIRGFYDLVFGYEDGDISKPNLEAGVSLLAMIRIGLCYHGGVMWKMQAGMGDVIFAPIYQLLKKRGVKFAYFNKVDELVPDGNKISQITITQQVSLKVDENDYEPFVDVKGLPCWPSTPNYAQIDDVQATLLRDNKINLESFWTTWPKVYAEHFKLPLPQKILRLGVDFDRVIFGISVGSLEHLCPQLLVQDAKLKSCSVEVKTVATQACQIWTDTPFTDLGWTNLPDSGEQPILSGFVEPYDTWAAMNQLLCREDWPNGTEPKNVAYFCSVQDISDYPSSEQHDFPVQCSEQAKQNAHEYLTENIYRLWPNVAAKGSFDWAILTDLKQQEGADRFDSQYWRSNVDPSERYVMSVAGSSAYRLATDGTQFDNLYLTGDWIQTGVNAGCVEAATMAGMETSRAICGYPETINGEHGFAPYMLK